MSGMSSVSATCFSSSRSDHRACPGGGAGHASAISLASTSPVTCEDTGGNSRFFRSTVAHTSPPVSANRLETSRTVSHETPTCSAMTTRSSTAPTAVSSASSNRARRITDAGCTPVRVTRSSASRSSAANVTGYFFCDGMTTSCLAEGKEDLPDPRLHHQSKNKQRQSTSGDQPRA
jgi:hypothetical protein